MGRPLRDKTPGNYRLITIRTLGACFFMRPSKDVNKTLGGILARYSEIFNIEIYAYVFLSNHFHLLIRCPDSNTDEFMENVDREIALRINWKIRRTGKFWSRRYDDEKVLLEEEDVLEAFVYINTNAVRHGLVSDAASWPGLCSYSQAISEQSKTYPFYHYSAKKEEDKVTHHKLKLTPLPMFAEMFKKERTALVREHIADRVKTIREERSKAGLGFMKPEDIINQDPFNTPMTVAKSNRPWGYSKSFALKRAYKKSCRYIRELYTEASMRYRFGLKDYKFPEYTFLPPTHRKPRLLPFTPLTEDYFKNVCPL